MVAHLHFLSLFQQSDKIVAVCTYSSPTAEDEDVCSYQPHLFDSTAVLGDLLNIFVPIIIIIIVTSPKSCCADSQRNISALTTPRPHSKKLFIMH